jgi:hypothetical protein
LRKGSKKQTVTQHVCRIPSSAETVKGSSLWLLSDGLSRPGIVVVYTPFVESNDRNKWHAKQGSRAIIQLYRFVRDYFHNTKRLR